MDFTTITASELVQMMKETPNCLIIDCRSFLVFNKGHIAGAINIRCNSIMRRRSKGLFALENAITNPETRQDFLSGKFSAVITYDEQGGNLCLEEHTPLKCKRTASMVVDVLLQNASKTTEVYYMNSAYKDFASKYPRKCQGCTRTSLPALPLNDSANTPATAQTPGSVFTPVYDQGTAVEILPHLYLGSGFHASQKAQIQNLGITAILNASSTCPNHFENDLKYKRIPVEDNVQADMSVWFNEAITFIDDIKQSGGKVLVHCHAGISRSATICLAYLIACNNVSLSDAFRYVKHRRSVISPNFSFMGQLQKLETDVAAKKSATLPIEIKSKFDFELSTVAEMEVQDENKCKEAKKFLERDFVKPLAPISFNKIRRCQNDPKPCLTAPPRVKELNFFGETAFSCSQQISHFDNHPIRRHSRTLTMST